jgi:hypothetical protein
VWLGKGSNPSWSVRYVRFGRDEGGDADGRDEDGCGGAAAEIGASADPTRAARAPQSRAMAMTISAVLISIAYLLGLLS